MPQNFVLRKKETLCQNSRKAVWFGYTPNPYLHPVMKRIKEFLSYHRAERRGIAGLLLIVLSLISYNVYQRVYWKTDIEEIVLEFGPQIVSFTQRMEAVKPRTDTQKPWQQKKTTLFKFDPNVLDSAGWNRLGFSPKQTAAILKYRRRGAQFRKPKDVKKLFVVDQERYLQLAPYIEIDTSKLDTATSPKRTVPKWEKPEYKKAEYKNLTVELNTADSAMLVKVKGIGPFYARVIIEYRKKLGGYRFKEQLLEVYGMDSAKYAAMANQLTLDSVALTKINVNTATFKQLLRHPYINFNQTKAIVNYRKQHGNFETMEDLQKIHILQGEYYHTIAPYLRVE